MFLTIRLELLTGLIGLLLVMRVLGKKTMAEVTPFDLYHRRNRPKIASFQSSIEGNPKYIGS